MELTLDRYLNDEDLRNALERRARRERAEHAFRLLFGPDEAMPGDLFSLEDACHSYASR